MIPAVQAAADALTATPLAAFIRTSAFAYPALEIVHIVGFALLFGSIVLVDLKLLGYGKAFSTEAVLSAVLPWTLGSLVLVLPSGALLLAAHADELARNPAMQIKLALLLVAAANALVLHRSRSRPTSGDTATDKRRHVPAAVLSLLTWVGVIAAGRLIAYV